MYRQKLTDDLLIIHIQLGVIRFLEQTFTSEQVVQIINRHGERWRKRAKMLVEQMEKEEAWYEGERVSHYVDMHDPVIMEKVDQIILEHQEDLTFKVL